MLGNEKKLSTIYLNVPPIKKNLYVASAQHDHKKLSIWIMDMVDEHIHERFITTALKEKIPFSTLDVSRDAEGEVNFNIEVMEEVFRKAGLPEHTLDYFDEPQVINWIIDWYLAYRERGGMPDPVMEAWAREGM